MDLLGLSSFGLLCISLAGVVLSIVVIVFFFKACSAAVKASKSLAVIEEYQKYLVSLTRNTNELLKQSLSSQNVDEREDNTSDSN
jgi:uncharacterized membrane protein YhiD involved in acid resistance